MFVIFFMFILDRNVDSYRDTDPYTVIFIGNAWLIAVLPPLQQLQVAPDGLPDGVVVQDWESHTRSMLSPAGLGLGGNVHTVAISHSLDDAGGLWSCESPVQTSHGLTSGIPKIERSSLKAMADWIWMKNFIRLAFIIVSVRLDQFPLTRLTAFIEC